MTGYRAVVADHIIEVKDQTSPEQFYDLANIQILCTYHNREKGKMAWARRELAGEPQSPNG